jgi:hypothetical protein
MNNQEPYSFIDRELLLSTPYPIHEKSWDNDLKPYILQELDNNILYGDILGITRELQSLANERIPGLSDYLKYVCDHADIMLNYAEKRLVMDIVREMKHQLEYGY